MFWLRLIQTYLCHEWNFFWGCSCWKMAKMCHQTHVHRSCDSLALSSNSHLATTKSKAGSNDCYLTRTWKNISMSATNAILSCLNLVKVPTVWLVRSGPCWLIFRHTLCCNQKQLESYWVWLDGTLHVEANTTLFHQLVYLWKSEHTMHKNFFHKFLVVMKILSLM